MKCKASAGVGIALSPDVKLIDIENILEGRILLTRVVLHGIKISAFCAYAPTEQYADSTKEILFSTLQKAIQKVKKEHPCFKILIGADTNATIGCNSFGSWSYLGPNTEFTNRQLQRRRERNYVIFLHCACVCSVLRSG